MEDSHLLTGLATLHPHLIPSLGSDDVNGLKRRVFAAATASFGGS